MKRLYAARQQRLADTLRELVSSGYSVEAHGGFTVRLILGNATMMSPWHLAAPAPRGLLLGATNYAERTLRKDCVKLLELVRVSKGSSRG
jgi:GntR family transcriptional regulator/MocR family aminotransferase